MVPLVYLASLTAARFSVDTPWFLPNLIISRGLLFAPFLLLRPIQIRKSQGKEILDNMRSNYRHSILVMLFGGIAMQIAHTTTILPVLAPMAAISNDPAISALSYDFLFGVFSLFLCKAI